MSRRDTIIFAVLINIGLLIVLFVTASKPEATTISEEEFVVPNEAIVEETFSEPIQVANNGGDEVDQLLNQLASRKHKEPAAPKVSENKPKKVVLTDKFVEVTVKRGDVLGRIAKANGVSVRDIMKTNDLQDSYLSIGQVLKIPLKQEIKVAKVDTSTSSGDKEIYTVRSGDNPWLIAMRNRIDLQDLLRLNDLDEESARRLKPGDQLRVR